MAVCLGGQLIRRRSVSEMRVDDEADPLELVQVSVDRRQVHVGGPALNVIGQFLGAPVGSADQGFKDRPPARCHPVPERPETGYQHFDGLIFLLRLAGLRRCHDQQAIAI